MEGGNWVERDGKGSEGGQDQVWGEPGERASRPGK